MSYHIKLMSRRLRNNYYCGVHTSSDGKQEAQFTKLKKSTPYSCVQDAEVEVEHLETRDDMRNTRITIERVIDGGRRW